MLEEQSEAARQKELLFTQFVHRGARTLLRLAARLVGPNDAEDVTQRAFEKLARRVQAQSLEEVTTLFNAHEDLLRLMCRITVCRAYEHLRRKRPILADDGAEIENRGDDTSVRSFTSLDVLRLEQACKELPPLWRIVLILHHFYGYTDAELAKILGIKKATIRSHIHRAKDALKRAMEPNND
jgi:RNA polymerase sigma factor (sigma-70 family)